jgi:hypothetical protein
MQICITNPSMPGSTAAQLDKGPAAQHTNNPSHAMFLNVVVQVCQLCNCTATSLPDNTATAHASVHAKLHPQLTCRPAKDTTTAHATHDLQGCHNEHAGLPTSLQLHMLRVLLRCNTQLQGHACVSSSGARAGSATAAKSRALQPVLSACPPACTDCTWPMQQVHWCCTYAQRLHIQSAIMLPPTTKH